MQNVGEDKVLCANIDVRTNTINSFFYIVAILSLLNHMCHVYLTRRAFPRLPPPFALHSTVTMRAYR